MPTYGHFIPYGHFPIQYILYGHFIPYGHFPLWTLFHVDILPYGQFAGSPFSQSFLSQKRCVVSNAKVPWLDIQIFQGLKIMSWLQN